MTKTGAGTLTLSGASTYTGATGINAGTLNLTGSLGNTAVTVADAAILTGEGSIGGSLALGTTTGTSLVINPNSAGALGVTGGVTLTGTNTVSFSEGPQPTGSPIDVFSHGGLTGTLGTNLVLDGASNYRTATWSNSGGVVSVDIGNKNLVWNGTSGGEWDLKTSSRWNGGEADLFAWGDAVTFDDTGTTTAINLSGDLRPASITVDSDTNNYAFTGSIGGVGSLLKEGTSTLTLNGANTYSGGTTISEGTIVVTGNNGGLGTGVVTLGDGNTGSGDAALLITNGRSVGNAITVSSDVGGDAIIGFSGTGGSYTAFTGAITLERDLIIRSGTTDRLHFSNSISGTGSLTIDGGQRVTMAGNNSYDGDLLIRDSGTLYQTFGGNNIPDTATVDVGTGAIFQVYISETAGALSGDGTLRPIAGNPTLTVGANDLSGDFGGTWTNSGGNHLNIVKTGSGTQTFSGTLTNPGALTINAGTATFTTTAEFGRMTNSAGTSAPNRGILGTGGTLRTETGADLTLRRSGAEFTGSVAVAGGTLTVGQTDALGTSSITLDGGTLAFDNSGSYFTPISGQTLTGGTLTTDVTTTNYSTLHNTTGDVVPGNTTHAYHGQIYLTAGDWSFAKRFDDGGSVTIDGTEVINNGTWNATATGVFTAATDGWYDIDVRVSQGGGGVGPSGGWTKGIGIAAGDTGGSTNQADYTAFEDGALGIRLVTENDYTLDQAVTVNSNSTIDTSAMVGTPGSGGIDGNGDSGDLNLTAALSGSGDLHKAGDGTLRIGASSNGFTGEFVVDGGRLLIDNYVQGTSGFTVNAGGVLETDQVNFLVGGHGTAVDASRVFNIDGGTWIMGSGHDARIGNVTLSNGATWTSNRGLSGYDALLADTSTGAATVTVSGTGTSVMNGSGGLHLQGVQNFNVSNTTGDAATDLEVSMVLASQGAIGGAAGGIRKQGAGTMTLEAVNTYTGNTIIEGGTLALGSSGSIAASDAIIVGASTTFDVSGVSGGFTLGSGQQLSGTGTVTGSVTASGTIAPGASPGTLNFDNDLGLNSSALLDFELNPTDMTLGGGINDLLAIGGALTLDGLLNVTATSGDFSAASLGDTWTLATYSGSLVDNGLDFGSMPTLANDYEWEINTSTPGTVNLTVIPEPRFMLLGSLGLLLILRRRRAS